MKRTLTLLIALSALALTATAAAGVVVYKNPFSKRSDFKQIVKLKGAAGKDCGKSWKGKKALGFTVDRGPEQCTLQTPVEGDKKRPDHTIQVEAKVIKRKTDRKVRDSAFVGVALRANQRSNYELRVNPKQRRWQLLKSGDVVERGREKGIEGLDRKNRLRLDAAESTLTARVNGIKLAVFKDREPAEVSGRKAALTYGNGKRSRKDVEGIFDKVKVLVPDP